VIFSRARAGRPRAIAFKSFKGKTKQGTLADALFAQTKTVYCGKLYQMVVEE
jgi:hypothetical protein